MIFIIKPHENDGKIPICALFLLKLKDNFVF